MPFVLILTVLVFVHELGHYLIAIRNGVKVEVFSIGMGKEIFGFTDKNGTRWRFSLIPFGGYVMMYGDKDPSSTPSADDIKSMTEEEKNKSLMGKTPLQRIAVSFAGPFANILYAFVAMFFLYTFKGSPINTNEIDKVYENTPAYEISLKQGDVIEKIDEYQINEGMDVIRVLQSLPKEKNSVSIEFKRDGEKIAKNLNFESAKVIGVSFKKEYKKYSFFKSVLKSIEDTSYLTYKTLVGMIQLFSCNVSFKNLGGPLSIAKMSGDISMTGDFWYLIFFSAMISINLGLINLFPFPALDGGNILVDAIELIIRKPLSLKLREMISACGLFVLMGFMVFATLNDLTKFDFIRNLFN